MQAWKRCHRDLILLLCLASFAHMALWIYGEHSPASRETNDSAEYVRTASNFLSTGTFYSGRLNREINPALFSRRPPLYPLLIALLQPISKNSGLIILVQIGFSLLGACLIWSILRNLRASRITRLVVTTLYLLYPSQLIYTHLIMAEVLLQLTLLASFFFLVQFVGTKQWYWLALCNLSLGLAALAKPIMVYYWIPNLFFHLWLLRRFGKQYLTLLSLIPLLLVTLWSYRNFLHTQYFHFSSIKTANMLHVNIRGTVRRAEGRNEAIRVTRELEKEKNKAESFAEASKVVERAFFSTMLRNWRTLLVAYPRGAILFFLDPGRFDLYEFLNLPHDIRGNEFLKGSLGDKIQKLRELPDFVLVYLLLMAIINLLVLAGFGYYVFSRHIPLELKLFVFAVVGYVLVIVAPTGLSRFRLSVMPFLFLALPPLLERLQRSKKAAGSCEGSPDDRKQGYNH